MITHYWTFWGRAVALELHRYSMHHSAPGEISHTVEPPLVAYHSVAAVTPQRLDALRLNVFRLINFDPYGFLAYSPVRSTIETDKSRVLRV